MGSFFSGSPATSSTSVVNSTPAWASNYGKSLSETALPAAQKGFTSLSGATPETYLRGGAQQIAGFNPDQVAGLSQTRNLAQQGNPLLNPALDETQKMISGDYLNSNPFVNDVVSNESQRIQEQMDRQFAGSGRYGSPTHSGITAERVAEATLPYLSQNYENERNRQMQAIGNVGALGAERYADPRMLTATGDIQQALTQRALDAQLQYQRDLGNTQSGIDKSLIEAGTLNPGLFQGQGTQTTTQTGSAGSPSIASTLLGGALTLGGFGLPSGGTVGGNLLGGLF